MDQALPAHRRPGMDLKRDDVNPGKNGSRDPRTGEQLLDGSGGQASPRPRQGEEEE